MGSVRLHRLQLLLFKKTGIGQAVGRGPVWALGEGGDVEGGQVMFGRRGTNGESCFVFYCANQPK